MLPTILTHAASPSSTRWRAKAAASSWVSQVLKTTILSVIVGRGGFLRRRLGPLGHTFANRLGVLGMLGQLQIFGVRLARRAEVVHALQRFAQLLKRFGRAWVPQGRLLVPVRSSAVVALFHVLVANIQVLGSFKRIQRIFFRLQRLVFFGKVLRPGRRRRRQLGILGARRHAQ